MILRSHKGSVCESRHFRGERLSPPSVRDVRNPRQRDPVPPGVRVAVILVPAEPSGRELGGYKPPLQKSAATETEFGNEEIAGQDK
jgi:hypothetical protein